MKKINEGIQLKFNCQEDFESMSQTERGKFCSSCQKEVIDFTKMSYSEIQQIRGGETKMCGIYTPEQIDPSLHPIELPKVRSLAFLSTILISLNFSSASAQSTVDPKVEQAQGASNAPNLTPEEAKEKSEQGQHISMSKAAAPEEETKIPPFSTDQKEKLEKLNKWYWSKRFPFLRKKRVRHYYLGF